MFHHLVDFQSQNFDFLDQKLLANLIHRIVNILYPTPRSKIMQSLASRSFQNNQFICLYEIELPLHHLFVIGVPSKCSFFFDQKQSNVNKSKTNFDRLPFKNVARLALFLTLKCQIESSVSGLTNISIFELIALLIENKQLNGFSKLITIFMSKENDNNCLELMNSEMISRKYFFS